MAGSRSAPTSRVTSSEQTTDHSAVPHQRSVCPTFTLSRVAPTLRLSDVHCISRHTTLQGRPKSAAAQREVKSSRPAGLYKTPARRPQMGEKRVK